MSAGMLTRGSWELLERRLRKGRGGGGVGNHEHKSGNLPFKKKKLHYWIVWYYFLLGNDGCSAEYFWPLPFWRNVVAHIQFCLLCYWYLSCFSSLRFLKHHVLVGSSTISSGSYLIIASMGERWKWNINTFICIWEICRQMKCWFNFI